MHTDLTAQQALMILNGLPHIGPIAVSELQRHFNGDTRAIFSASRLSLLKVKGIGNKAADSIECWQDHFNLVKEEMNLKSKGAAFVPQQDSDYPALLKETHDPPLGLYWLGDYRVDRPCIAIIGSRRSTLYGQKTARYLARDVARRGFCVVSGLARGIDTAAHEGALEADGKTIAIMGSGLDIIYPPENLDLYRRISATGAVVSEFPFGRRPDRKTFPMRNRLISGMCLALVVVETDIDGGSMITAHFAGEQGRSLFAVPGRIDQNSSRGCHQLIRDGATLLTSVDDILEDLNYLKLRQPNLDSGSDSKRDQQSIPDGLNDLEKRVLECFKNGEMITQDTVVERTQLSVQVVASTLILLELKKLVIKRSDGKFESRL